MREPEDILKDVVGYDGETVHFPADPLLKNWFIVDVPPAYFADKALKSEVVAWLLGSSKLGWLVQFGNGWRRDASGQSSFTVNFCRVLFRTRSDAALFKMFWGFE
jgi:hypothetical protein